MITRAKISAVRANSFVVVEQFTTFSQFRCHCLLLYQNLRPPAWEGKPLPHLKQETSCAQVTGKRKREVGLVVPAKFTALTQLRIARILERELTARAEKYSHFELKNI